MIARAWFAIAMVMYISWGDQLNMFLRRTLSMHDNVKTGLASPLPVGPDDACGSCLLVLEIAETMILGKPGICLVALACAFLVFARPCDS